MWGRTATCPYEVEAIMPFGSITNGITYPGAIPTSYSFRKSQTCRSWGLLLNAFRQVTRSTQMLSLAQEGKTPGWAVEDLNLRPPLCKSGALTG